MSDLFCIQTSDEAKRATWTNYSTQTRHKFTDHDGYHELSKLSYKILLITWCLFSVVITNAFSGSILASLNIRLHDQPIDTFGALARALRRGETKAGTFAGTILSDMIDVSPERIVAFMKFLRLCLSGSIPSSRILKATRSRYSSKSY